MASKSLRCFLRVPRCRARTGSPKTAKTTLLFDGCFFVGSLLFARLFICCKKMFLDAALGSPSAPPSRLPLNKNKNNNNNNNNKHSNNNNNHSNNNDHDDDEDDDDEDDNNKTPSRLPLEQSSRRCGATHSTRMLVGLVFTSFSHRVLSTFLRN
ncbi:unnamed protein product [Polarella glacialis]|uniref:Uncharacterized protein n=1 Tax=Polarella glacialis TaxID=89957 RepID=A0A813EXQ4_POLGL|nr:unnamed protein product [Polarella glacialis]